MAQFNDLTEQTINRLMNLREFTVSVPVTEGWLPTGVVPFDIKIKNCIATITLPALNEEEARSRVIDYVNGNGDED